MAGGHLLQVLFDHAPDGITLVDPHHPSGLWTIVECNDTACAMHGYARHGLVGQPLDRLNVLPSHPEGNRSFLELLRREGTIHGQALHRRLDGSVFPVEYGSTLIEVDGRELILGFDRDVSEREYLEHLRVLFDRSPDATLLIDPGIDGQSWSVVDCNAIACVQSGYDREELIGEPVGKLHGTVDDTTAQAELWGRLQRGETVKAETVLRRKDGAVLAVEASMGLVAVADRHLVLSIERDVTERKRAERALAHSREELAAILSGVADGITVQRPGGQIAYANEAAARLIGYPSVDALLERPSGEMLGKFELMTPSGEPFPLADLPGRRVLEGLPGDETLLRFRIVATGEERWAVVHAAPVFAPDGSIQFAITTFHDVTDRERAVASLRERARQQAAVASLGQQALARVDLAVLLHTAIERVCDTLDVQYVALMELRAEEGGAVMRAGAGWPREMIGRYVAPLENGSLSGYTLQMREPVIVEDLRTESRFAVAPALLERGIVSSIGVIVQGEGQPFGALNAFSTRPRHFSGDDVHFLQSVANVLAAAVDREWVEEARRAALRREQVAREQAEDAARRLSFLADMSRVLARSLDYGTTLREVARLVVPGIADWCGVYIRQPDGSIHLLAAEHIDPARVALAHELYASFPADPDARTGVGAVIRTGQPEFLPRIDDALLVASARSPRHLELLRALGLASYLIVPLKARGRTFGAITLVSSSPERAFSDDDRALAEDMAQRAAQAIDNAQLYEDAQEAIRMRDVFFSVAAHELRTPITALSGQAQLLRRRAERDGNLAERDRRAVATIGDQAQRLTRLVNAMLDIARIERGQLRLDTQRLDLAALVGHLVDEMRLTADRHTIQLELPDRPVMIDGDALRLEQVVQNLVSNATKYSPGGGMIEVAVEQRDDQACLIVVDQGIGISAADLPHIFERFYRADHENAAHITGMGVGLYVVKEIVALHGGSITADSVLGRGSTFTVCFPCL